MSVTYRYRSERRIAQYAIKSKVFQRETVWYRNGVREFFDVLTIRVSEIILSIEELVDLKRVSLVVIAQDYVDIHFKFVQPDDKIFEAISKQLTLLVESSVQSA